MWPKSSTELFEVTRGAHITLIAQQHSKWLSHNFVFHCCMLSAPVLKCLDHADPSSGENISTSYSIIRLSEWSAPPPKSSFLLCETAHTAVLPSCNTPAHAMLWIDTITTAVGQRLSGEKKGKTLLGKKNWHKVHCTYCTLGSGRWPTLASCQVYNKTNTETACPSWAESQKSRREEGDRVWLKR